MESHRTQPHSFTTLAAHENPQPSPTPVPPQSDSICSCEMWEKRSLESGRGGGWEEGGAGEGGLLESASTRGGG